MVSFNKVKNIVVEDSHIVVFLEFNKELELKIEEIDKIFIRTQKSKSLITFAILLMALPVLLSYFSILPINITLLGALAIIALSVLIRFNLNQYKLIIRTKAKEHYNFSISADSKFKIVQKVRIVRTKLREINIISFISPVSND